jgi:hypothetical protein
VPRRGDLAAKPPTATATNGTRRKKAVPPRYNSLPLGPSLMGPELTESTGRCSLLNMA